MNVAQLGQKIAHERTVALFASQFAQTKATAHKHLEAAGWNYNKAFDSLVAEVRAKAEAQEATR